jgi:hypothetical protein
MISTALSAIKELGSIARELDKEGLSIQIQYKGSPAVTIGQRGHAALLDFVYGPVKINGTSELLEILKGFSKR